MARVTIGVPVYNGARFLAAALEAHLVQTFEDFQLVVSDNGSTDDTEEICRAYVARDSRVRYLRNDRNRGAAWNYNNLVHATSSSYFRWASCDDLVAPTHLERCIEVFEEGGDRVALVYPRTQLIDENGDLLQEWADNLDLRQKTPHERLRALMGNFVLGNVSFGLIRRDVLEKTRLVDRFPSSDYTLLTELAMLGEFHEVSERLFSRRMHAGMSRQANVTSTQVAAWFDPVATGRHKREFTRLFVEHFRSIGRLPLGAREGARCFATVLGVWLPQNGLHVIDELFGLEYTRDSRVRFRRRRSG